MTIQSGYIPARIIEEILDTKIKRGQYEAEKYCDSQEKSYWLGYIKSARDIAFSIESNRSIVLSGSDAFMEDCISAAKERITHGFEDNVSKEAK